MQPLSSVVVGLLCCSIVGSSPSPAQSIVFSGGNYARTEEVTVLGFERTSELPDRIAGNYEQLTSDSKEAGVPPPSFYVAYYDLQHNGEKDVFVRAENAISCSANGQCQIDLYARDDMGYRKIFSVIAQNIGLIASPTAPRNSYPILLTNIPVGQSFAERTLALDTSKVGAVWRWNGKSYEPAH